MKQYKLLSLLAGVSLMAFTSCDLEEMPTTSIGFDNNEETVVNGANIQNFENGLYSAFRAIASLSLAQTRFNEEEYVCELFTLLSSFPLQFPRQFNRDPSCVLDVLRTADAYLYSASTRGKTACFALLNKIAKLQTDNDAVLQVLAQAAPTLLHVGCGVEW